MRPGTRSRRCSCGLAMGPPVANVETATDFQDLRAWPAVVVETARILRQTYTETLVVPLTVLKPASAETLAAGLAAVNPDLWGFRLVASEEMLRARILQRPETAGPHAWCLEHLVAGKLLIANAVFRKVVPTDHRNPEQVADSVLAHLVTTWRVATVADRMFARRTHHFAYRDVVERQFWGLGRGATGRLLRGELGGPAARDHPVRRRAVQLCLRGGSTR